MAKIIIAVAASERAEHWLEVFREQQPAHEYVLWQPGADTVGADYALVWQPDKQLFMQEPQLKAIFNLGAGVDALGINEVIPAHLPVYRLEDGGMAQQMAEFALYGLLLATQRFAPYPAQQKEKQWRRHPPVIASEWPVGVMGYGQIGAHVAKVFAQLGYPVAAWARSARETPPEINFYHGTEQLAGFLGRTRLLINVLPLTEATRGIINAQNLQLLQVGGFLVNMARGPHVCDEDLISKLDSGHLSGALLDVFHVEPLPETHPFWTHPAVHITPHIAGISLHDESARQVLEKIEQIEQGKTPTGRVNPELGY